MKVIVNPGRTVNDGEIRYAGEEVELDDKTAERLVQAGFVTIKEVKPDKKPKAES